MNKRVFSIFYTLFFLLNAGQTQAMFKKTLLSTVGLIGGGTSIYLGNEYIRKPLKNMRKNGPYLAPKEVQEMSNEFLDAMTDKNSIKDKLHTWYLKKFGYNKVYVNDPLNNISKRSGKIGVRGYIPIGLGGIHVSPKLALSILGPKLMGFYALQSVIAHENGHLHNRDCTKLSFKILRSLYLKNIGKSKIAPKLIGKRSNSEVLAEKKKIKVLFKKQKYKALYISYLDMKALLDNKFDPECMIYGLAALIEFEKLFKKYPKNKDLQVIPVAYKKYQERIQPDKTKNLFKQAQAGKSSV